MVDDLCNSTLNALIDNKTSIKKIKEKSNENINKLKSLKSYFKISYSDLIEKISELESIKSLDNQDEEESSPAGKQVTNQIPLFEDGSNVYTSNIAQGSYYTFSIAEPLPNNFEITIKLMTLKGFCVFGVSNKILNEPKGYLGGDMGEGNWGIANNGALGHNGKWISGGFPYKEGDKVTLKGEDMTITHSLNDVWADNKQVMEGDELYLTFTFNESGCVIQILEGYDE